MSLLDWFSDVSSHLPEGSEEKGFFRKIKMREKKVL